MTMEAITGNTFPVKDAIRALGGKWNADKKAWMVPESNAARARQLVQSAPLSQTAGTGKCSKCGAACKSPYTICWHCRPAPTRCKECNREADRYNRIYKSGVCSSCYRDEREEREMGY